MEKIILQNTDLSDLRQQGRPLLGPSVPSHCHLTGFRENDGM